MSRRDTYGFGKDDNEGSNVNRHGHLRRCRGCVPVENSRKRVKVSDSLGGRVE